MGEEYGLVKGVGSARPDGWAFRFPSTNTTILYYWSASLCDIEPIDPTSQRQEG
ncbi:PC-Esterase [Artemisia annua]|uniref:PC-Esterase n=1 Tax=Artemisia annua TaxID=35608 RepID=A0A2U1PI85_ARTAN|nr:PC-Esterase [Artemisia annua]